MEIVVEWQKPILVAKHKKVCIDADNLPDQIQQRPGVYFFSRRFGLSYEPFYIGESGGVRGRLKSHLKSVSIMDVLRGIPIKGFKGIKSGERYFHVGYVKTKPGQSMPKCLNIVQRYLIEDAMAQNMTLLNHQLTVIRTHDLKFVGKRAGRGIYKRAAKVRITKGE
jgi:hypothetical protein